MCIRDRFSELVKFSLDLSEEEFAKIPPFEEENADLGPLAHPAELLPLQQLGSAEEVPDFDVHSRMQPRSSIGSDSGQSVQDDQQFSGGGPFGYETGRAAAQGAA